MKRLIDAPLPCDTDIVLQSSVVQDDITANISNAFDYAFSGTVETRIKVPQFPKEFQIGLIVGSSGSGKSTLAKTFGEFANPVWDNSKCIASHFKDFNDASRHFGAVGLNSIPTWLKPYSVLSVGEKFRADMARSLYDGAVIDEFTSVVNRECAISCSNAISKYIRGADIKNVVFASCHDDIIPWLQPDWVYDTDKQAFLDRGSLRQRPSIVLEVRQCSNQVWSMFAKHHYLTQALNPSATCYLASWKDIPVAFQAVLAMPGKFGDDPRISYSGHRLVVLPDYQGLGIGNRLSEYIGDLYLSQGYRYFSKTANPRAGEHRQRSPKWKPTVNNLRKPKNADEITTEKLLSRMGHNNANDFGKHGKSSTPEAMLLNLTRLCYSHEYIGDGTMVIKPKEDTTRKRLF